MLHGIVVVLKYQFVLEDSFWYFCFILISQGQEGLMIGANNKIWQSMQVNVTSLQGKGNSGTFNFYLRVALFKFGSRPSILSENPTSVDPRVQLCQHAREAFF